VHKELRILMLEDNAADASWNSTSYQEADSSSWLNAWRPRELQEGARRLPARPHPVGL